MGPDAARHGSCCVDAPRRRGRQAGGRPGTHRDQLRPPTTPISRARRPRADVVVLHEWEKERLRALKAANPRITVLMIKNLSSITAAEYGNAGTGISTQQAADHPEWYLLNTSGKRFTFNDYGYLWAADIGNRDYQVRWAANVAAKLKADPWDGVLVDDANPTMEYHYPVGAVAKYPTDAAYQQATGSALALIGPRLRAQGKLVVANFGSWRVYRSAVTPWLKYVYGGMEEHFTKYGDDSPARATSPAPTGTTCSACSRRPRPQGSCSSASRTRTSATAPRPATAGRRCCSPRTALPRSRCTTTTPRRPGSPSTATTSARPAARSPSWPVASTGARSSAASCSSTPPRRAWPCGSAVATAAPACAPRAPR